MRVIRDSGITNKPIIKCLHEPVSEDVTLCYVVPAVLLPFILAMIIDGLQDKLKLWMLAVYLLIVFLGLIGTQSLFKQWWLKRPVSLRDKQMMTDVLRQTNINISTTPGQPTNRSFNNMCKEINVHLDDKVSDNVINSEYFDVINNSSNRDHA